MTGSLRILHVMRAPVGGLFRHVVDLARTGSARTPCRPGRKRLDLTFATSASTSERLHIVLAFMFGTLAIGTFVALLLSLPPVADLFAERATLDQTHDIGHHGRFGRYIFGAGLALDHPLGIGPLQFSRFVREDPHNSFLNAVHGGRLARRLLHWRHYFLILGVLWGLMAATRAHSWRRRPTALAAGQAEG